MMTGERVAGPFTGHTDFVNSVAFSPHGHYIVSGSSDQTVCMWDVTNVTGGITHGSSTGPIESVPFSPDGK
jgi:WD40 repeat protein